jgi:hypothetical protein
MINRPLASKAKARASAWAVDPLAVPPSVSVWMAELLSPFRTTRYAGRVTGLPLVEGRGTWARVGW